MSNVALSGNASGTGTFTIASPNSNTNRTLNLPDASGGVVLDSATQTLTNKTIQGGTITSGTAVASTSGTSIDFTGIPSWVRRITVMFAGVSTNGTSAITVRVGAGSVQATGYLTAYVVLQQAQAVTVSQSTTGYDLSNATAAAATISGSMRIELLASNTWIATHLVNRGSDVAQVWSGSGSCAVSGTLDRVRITTANGTDTFDAGSINILYEG
jgi:hypothetical protein